jgi:predicted DNA-binding protein
MLLCMYDERLQILLTAEQRRRLEAEARRRSTSVAALVREAIDARFEPVDRERRRAALAELERIGAAYRGPTFTPEELGRLVEESHTAEILAGFRR